MSKVSRSESRHRAAENAECDFDKAVPSRQERVHSAYPQAGVSLCLFTQMRLPTGQSLYPHTRTCNYGKYAVGQTAMMWVAGRVDNIRKKPTESPAQNTSSDLQEAVSSRAAGGRVHVGANGAYRAGRNEVDGLAGHFSLPVKYNMIWQNMEEMLYLRDRGG